MLSVSCRECSRSLRVHLQVSPHNVLEHRRLSAGLTTDDGDLRKIDGVVDADGREDILKLVHQPKINVLSAVARARVVWESLT